jgi:PIN domain nuclease of toxin-antitoxin system
MQEAVKKIKTNTGPRHRALPLSEEEVLYVARLTRLHRDPFDRMLICQVVVNGFAVLTTDPLISQYVVAR